MVYKVQCMWVQDASSIEQLCMVMNLLLRSLKGMVFCLGAVVVLGERLQNQERKVLIRRNQARRTVWYQNPTQKTQKRGWKVSVFFTYIFQLFYQQYATMYNLTSNIIKSLHLIKIFLSFFGTFDIYTQMRKNQQYNDIL